MSQETKIYLVRHGETEWNTQKKLQGTKDSPLTSRGIEQAHGAKKLLAHLLFDHAYVSPSNRARNTLEIILEDKLLEGTIRQNLREIHLGPWEGKTLQETAISDPEEYLNFWKKPEIFKLSGVETFQHVQDRMVEEIENIFTEAKNKNILVVSHGMAIKVALAHYLSKPLSELTTITDPKNCGVICLSKKGNKVFIQQE